MNSELIHRMQTQFDAVAQSVPENGVEFWFARDLQEPMGYARWENFIVAIQRVIISCQTTGYNPDDHFRGVTKMVPLGRGAQRAVDDFMLTRAPSRRPHHISILPGNSARNCPHDPRTRLTISQSSTSSNPPAAV